ncbi:MAG TPA: hypothetical protein VIL74_24690 [Pyrinomonadaceae bacterium]|jgi:hypothetical protein
MINRYLLLLLISLLCVADARPQSQKTVASKETNLCDRVSQIKEIPFRYDEKGVDQNFDALYEAGESALPCLIERIADATVMNDPRCPRISEETKVGDVAYFVLVGIAKIRFEEMLPASVQTKYKTEGVYAYHEYVEQKGKRRELQARLRQWYRQKTKSEQ